MFHLLVPSHVSRAPLPYSVSRPRPACRPIILHLLFYSFLCLSVCLSVCLSAAAATHLRPVNWISWVVQQARTARERLSNRCHLRMKTHGVGSKGSQESSRPLDDRRRSIHRSTVSARQRHDLKQISHLGADVTLQATRATLAMRTVPLTGRTRPLRLPVMRWPPSFLSSSATKSSPPLCSQRQTARLFASAPALRYLRQRRSKEALTIFNHKQVLSLVQKADFPAEFRASERGRECSCSSISNLSWTSQGLGREGEPNLPPALAHNGRYLTTGTPFHIAELSERSFAP
ncbi:hypothetical protein F4780DRAFT_507923 [Xylariomycetidae sp. FL0641]|nr:hypothetical protein F4780DRAFT_507923 [Xylariomycetidae sp. FL0641]